LDRNSASAGCPLIISAWTASSIMSLMAVPRPACELHSLT
jgi:hypothetical protein